MKKQDEIFFSELEGDAWFARNQAQLQTRENGLLMRALGTSVRGKKVLEIGCSNGYLLEPLAKRGAMAWGIDPSLRAIRAGKKKFPVLCLRRGASHDLSQFQEGFFDIVIISFVLHWVDRTHLLQTVAEIDRVLKVGGILCIQDFYPDKPHKVRYKHRLDRQVYTYKQMYEEIFLASHCYVVLKRIGFYLGDLNIEQPKMTKGSDSCALILMRKTGEKNYLVRTLSSRTKKSRR